MIVAQPPPYLTPYRQFAAGLGVATEWPSFDFETYSESGFAWDDVAMKWRTPEGAPKTSRGLSVVGVRAYVEHPSFDVLSLAYDLRDGTGPHLWRPGMANPHDLLAHVERFGILSGWNTEFELTVWNHHCAKRYGWPRLMIEQLRCSMAKARVHGLPGKLENAGRVLELPPELCKEPDGKRLLKKFSEPRNPTKKDVRTRVMPCEEPEDGAKLYGYNAQDLVAESAVGVRCPDLDADELAIWFADQRINQRGIQVDLKAVDDCIAIVTQAYERYNTELYALTGWTVKAASEVEALKRWLGNHRCPMVDLNDEAVSAKLHDLARTVRDAEMDRVYRVLKIRSMLGSASIKKLFAFKLQASAEGRLHGLYQYFAARTGRWTGNGPQPQNLPRGRFKAFADVERCLEVISHRCLDLVEFYYDDALDAVSSCLRALLIAAPGHDLICSDYSAIEGVVTAALAGEEWRLEVFRTHGMIYEMSAAKIMGIEFDEFVEHKKRTGHHHPMRQTLGKVAELASGFGGWIGAWERFGADEFLSRDEIKRAILAWRRESPLIVELWGGQTRGFGYDARPELFGLEGAIVSAIQDPGQAYRYRDITYQVRNDVLYCTVPGGGTMAYHKPRLAPSTREYASPWELSISYEGWNSNPLAGPIGWVRMSLYGGKATENVVQKVARAILAHALVNLDRAGYWPILHSHDEPCGEVAEGWGSIEEFEAIMNTLPAWAKGWPIKARGGWRGKRYRKD